MIKYLPMIRTNMGLAGSIDPATDGLDWEEAVSLLRQQWREAASRHWSWLSAEQRSAQIEREIRRIQAEHEDAERARPPAPSTPETWVRLAGSFPSYANCAAWYGVGAPVADGVVLGLVLGANPSPGMLAHNEAGRPPVSGVYRDAGPRGWVRFRDATTEEKEASRRAVEDYLRHGREERLRSSEMAARLNAAKVAFFLGELLAPRYSYETLNSQESDRREEARLRLREYLFPSRRSFDETEEERVSLFQIERKNAMGRGLTEEEIASIFA